MIMLDSWTSGWSGGTRAMVTLAVTETVLPEGLMVQRGGARTRSSSFSGESITAGLWGQSWGGEVGVVPDLLPDELQEGTWGGSGSACWEPRPANNEDWCGFPDPSELYPASVPLLT